MAEQKEAHIEMAEQEEAVNKCMPFIPDEMDKNEGRNLMMLLYKTGFLSDYLNDLDAVDENGLDADGDKLEFSSYFSFKNEINVDPQTSKITFLKLERMDYTDNEEEHKTFDLPSMIKKFDSLEEIVLWNCLVVPIELRRLSKLKRIALYECRKNLLENIPEGLQLPSSTKMVEIYFFDSDSYSSLSPFMKILPDELEGIKFGYIRTRERTDEILRILQEDDLNFSQHLTSLWMERGELNDDDFELLLFEIRSNFPNLHTIDVCNNKIKSLSGIVARIKRMSSSSSSSPSSTPQIKLPNNNNLCKICLMSNPIVQEVIMKNATSADPKEKAAVLTFLNAFDQMSNLGLNPFDWNDQIVTQYDPDIEYLLRRNKVNMKYITTATEGGNSSGNSANINRSLWPLIFERAYTKSHEIYDYCSWTAQKDKDRMKCATGLFELVCKGQFFAEEHPRRFHYDSTRKKITTTTDCGSSNNNTTVKRKRST